jgi:acetyl-CoA acetyltransferase
MADALIFDHVRTPRGRGKKDGALYEVPAVRLAAQPLQALRDRNDLDTKLVDDVVLGCVDPIGEAGGDIARAATCSPPVTIPARPASRSTVSAPPAWMPSISAPPR